MLLELSMLESAQRGEIIVVPLSVRTKLMVSCEVRNRMVSTPVEIETRKLQGKKVFYEWQEASESERRYWKDASN